MNLFDTHCHLQDPRLFSRLEEVLRAAGKAGVRAMLCCGAEEDDWPRVVEMARRFPSIVPALGVHPLYDTQRRPGWLDRLKGLLLESGAAVGEIGLDHAMKPRNERDQEEVFVAQLRLAIELNRPVSIHCRQAWGRMPELLRTIGVPKAGAVIHSYSGGKDLVRPLIDLGVYLSFSGSITRSNNRRGCEAVPSIPQDRLLVETDSPDIMPMIDSKWPPKGAVNEPANLVHVARKLAELRGVTAEELADHVWENACRVFGGDRVSPRAAML